VSLGAISSPEFGDSEYLQSIRSHIREIVALDNRFGGADLVRLSARFFRTLHDQLGTGTYDPKLERDLHSAAGELASWRVFMVRGHKNNWRRFSSAPAERVAHCQGGSASEVKTTDLLGPLPFRFRDCR
jgi:hypothetical protein